MFIAPFSDVAPILGEFQAVSSRRRYFKHHKNTTRLLLVDQCAVFAKTEKMPAFWWVENQEVVDLGGTCYLGTLWVYEDGVKYLPQLGQVSVFLHKDYVGKHTLNRAP